MKLACFSDTCAVPSRKPFSPADSISLPAESPSGLVNTEPALAPPGWCSRRHLTMAATASCSASTDPGVTPIPPPRRAGWASPRRCGSRRPGGRRRRSPRRPRRGRPSGTGRGTRPCPTRALRRSCAPRPRPNRARRRPTTTRTSRHRPPGGPGPGAPGPPPPAPRRGRVLGSGRSDAAAPAARRRGGQLEPGETATEMQDDPVEPLVGHQQVGAAPDDEDRRAHSPAARCRAGGPHDVQVGRDPRPRRRAPPVPDAVGRQRAERPLQRGPLAQGAGQGVAGRHSWSPLRRCEEVVGQRGQVARPQGEAEVARLEHGAHGLAQLLPAGHVGDGQPRVLRPGRRRPPGGPRRRARDARRRCRCRSPPARRHRRRRSRTASPVRRCGRSGGAGRPPPRATTHRSSAVARAARTSVGRWA